MDFRSQLAAEVPPLRRFARALTGDAALADDLVQDCVERALLKTHLYDPSRPLPRWSYRRVAQHLYQRAPPQRPLHRHQDSGRSVRRRGRYPPEQEHGLAVGSVTEALDRLSPQHREIIVLVALEEMSYRDVAEILGVPQGTVMSRLSRAREHFRQMLEARGHTGLRRVK